MRPSRGAAAPVDPAELEQAREDLDAKTAAARAVAGLLPDNRERLRNLRQAWERGGRPEAEPERGAYAAAPHQLVTGYLTDERDVPWAPRRSGA